MSTTPRSEEDEMDAFNEKANEIFETFLDSMSGDSRFVRPVEEDDSLAEEEGIGFWYTDRGSELADRMLDRLSGLAQKKFGARAIEIDIESHLYKEL